ELVKERPRVAYAAFDAVYDELPGEIAPKLALAVSAERIGDYFQASRLYELVWRTDRSDVSAAFGLARVYVVQGARESAIEVLEAVPTSSRHHVIAQTTAIRIKIRSDSSHSLQETELVDAAERAERLSLDIERRTRLSADVLRAAFDWVRKRS